MTADFHQKAKALFAELVDAPTATQNKRLEEIAKEDPNLASEVGSLLHYHTAQSLVTAPSTPKIRTRSTLSTQYENQTLEWFTIPGRALLISLPLFILAMILASLAATRIESQLADMVSNHLADALKLKIQDFDAWEGREVDRAVRWAEDPRITSAVEDLVDAAKNAQPSELQDILSKIDASERISQTLQELAGRPVKYAVWDRQMNTLADWNQGRNPDILGSYVTRDGANTLARVLKGRPAMYLPNLSVPISLGYTSEGSSPVLSIFVPIRSSKERIVAVLMLRGYGLEEEYKSMLQDWNIDATKEFFIVSRDGTMVTESKYDVEAFNLTYRDQNKKRMIVLRDPGVNLLAGEQPSRAPSTWQETLLARQAKSKNDGLNISGYRSYLGQKVVGAWQWMPRHAASMAVESDYAATFRAATAFRWTMYGITTVFGLSLLAFCITTAWKQVSRRRLRDISEVGPYQIQEVIGEGGMGRVYLAEHTLLCRQSAVKVLLKGDNDLSIISRFEREVQLASQLTHPNTIAIYDFGRNKDGIFYYAMEYINGAHLGQLIEYAGPLQPGRCIYVLRQLCRALQEAHQAGVVHRDIKPQNIMVCNRGGEPDFVKLFDYGLVKAFAPGVSHSTSQTEVVVGTPRFMAPERLNSPWLADPRVDIYSIGALAYFLLTGQLPPLVSPSEAMEYEQPGVETLDLPANVVQFGGLLSICMSVESSARPSSMNSLLHELDLLSDEFHWSREDSESWWEENEAKLLQYVASKRKNLNTPLD